MSQFRRVFLSALIILLFIFLSKVFANNLSVSNVSLAERKPSTHSVVVQFDLSWENSWRSKINHDAIWVTARLNNSSIASSEKKLCQLSVSGLNPAGTAAGSNSGLEVYVPSDKLGAFVRLNSFGTKDQVLSTSVQLTVDYQACGFSDDTDVNASVTGIEMVYIPQGSFHAGDYATSTASLVQGSGDPEPWDITGEGIISVGNSVSDGYRYVSAENQGEDSTGTSFTIPSNFPKGFHSFYVMKYEITEGLWVEFVNSISDAARQQRDLTDNNHKNSDAVLYRNTISCSGSPLVCSAQRPFRSLNYLTWMDLAALLDWAGLRPLSELEFEKIARGPILPIAGEYAWGTTNLFAATSLSGTNENGTETLTDTDANANDNNTILTGGDSSQGAPYAQGPLRAGIFANNTSDRVKAGAGYYGVMELSGNVKECTVTIGNAAGRAYAGTNGDGILTSAVGHEGNANQTDWPGIDVLLTNGVTAATGSGFRGGAWDDQDSRLRISDRSQAALTDMNALNDAGGRGARSLTE